MFFCTFCVGIFLIHLDLFYISVNIILYKFCFNIGLFLTPHNNSVMKHNCIVIS